VAYTSEIDKLEARFRDNPKGRNFAPLADAYRKAGLIDNAIDLCQNGLKLHPDYVSAYIVYARCLVDKKDDASALGVFKKVLELDGENIIALRGLAELAERNSRYDEAVEWLGRLLNADPMNGDAAEALARAKQKAGKPVEPPAESAQAAPAPPKSAPGLEIEHEERETAHTELSAHPTPPLVENVDDSISFNPGAHAAAKADGLEFQEEVELNPQDIEQVEVEGLARTQYESGAFKLDAPEPDDGLPEVDLPLIMPDETASASQIRQPPEPPRPPPPPSPSPPPARVPAAVALSDDDGAADTATLSQAEPVLTETMAELYLKQGHQQDALRVYQALLAQRPDDARLRSKVEQLSPDGKRRSGVSARGFLKGILSGGSRGATPPSASASEPRSTLAAAFDVAGPSAGSSLGEPSRPAHDTISLDSVFGDHPKAPAREAPPADSAQPEGGGGGFSFDQFFAGGKAGTPRSATATPDSAPGAAADSASAKTPGRTSGRSQRPAEDEADADQFQQWLKKLKS
jgi:tetratricopeptide (TPR) repeat protein